MGVIYLCDLAEDLGLRIDRSVACVLNETIQFGFLWSFSFLFACLFACLLLPGCCFYRQAIVDYL